jgi:hypothetical protein
MDYINTDDEFGKSTDTYVRKIINQFTHKRIKRNRKSMFKSQKKKQMLIHFLNRANHNNDTVL